MLGACAPCKTPKLPASPKGSSSWSAPSRSNLQPSARRSVLPGHGLDGEEILFYLPSWAGCRGGCPSSAGKDRDALPPPPGTPTWWAARCPGAGEALPRSSCMRSSSHSRNSRASCCALPRNCAPCLATMLCGAQQSSGTGMLRPGIGAASPPNAPPCASVSPSTEHRFVLGISERSPSSPNPVQRAALPGRIPHTRCATAARPAVELPGERSDPTRVNSEPGAAVPGTRRRAVGCIPGSRGRGPEPPGGA